MIWGLFGILFGVFAFGWGFYTLNDPTCASVRVSLKYRGGDFICYPAGSFPDGPINGNFFAFGIMAFGLVMLAGSIFSIEDLKRRKLAKDANYILALGVLGIVKGQSQAVHSASGAEGNLFWSAENFVFLSDEPFASGISQLSPIAFGEVEIPNFRIPVLSNNGFLLEFPAAGLTFTSESGKIKNLKKEINRFKKANPD
jgi:hypothetical protein